MCADDQACGPCAAKACATVKQTTAPLVVWGPISDEVPSHDNPPKLIRMEAIEAAFPQLLARGVVDVHHDSALIVAKLRPVIQVDQARVPAAQREMVREVQEAYGGLPTGMVTVTPAIAKVFPRVARRLGERLPFAASEVFGDNRTSQAARQDILAGRLDSYSLAGAQFGAHYAEHCDKGGCQVVQEIPSMDLSALTFTSHERRTVFGKESRAANPGAGFAIVQQTAPQVESLKDAGSGVRVVDESPPSAPVVEAKPSPAPEPTPVAGLGLVVVESEPVAVTQTAPPTPPAEPVVVKQEDEAKPAETPPASKTDVDAVIAQLVKRLTDLEVEVALLKGRKEEAPTPEPAKEPVKEEAPKDDADKKDEAPKALKQTLPSPAVLESANTPTPSIPGAPAADPEFASIMRDLDAGDPSALKRLRNTFGGRKA